MRFRMVLLPQFCVGNLSPCTSNCCRACAAACLKAKFTRSCSVSGFLLGFFMVLFVEGVAIFRDPVCERVWRFHWQWGLVAQLNYLIRPIGQL